MFVTGISAVDNTVTIGENGSQYSSGLVADSLNFIPFDNLIEPMRADVKIRFRAKPAPATVTPNNDGTVTVIFDEPQRSVTPGQSAVFYDGDTVIGGGRIISAVR
jgi:tRNA-specific 2-thiouridylase